MPELLSHNQNSLWWQKLWRIREDSTIDDSMIWLILYYSRKIYQSLVEFIFMPVLSVFLATYFKSDVLYHAVLLLSWLADHYQRAKYANWVLFGCDLKAKWFFVSFGITKFVGKAISCNYWKGLQFIIFVECSCYIFDEWFVFAWELLFCVLLLAWFLIFSYMLTSLFVIVVNALNASNASMSSIDKYFHPC